MKEETTLFTIRKSRDFTKQEEDFYYEIHTRESESQIEVFTRWYFQGQVKPWKKKVLPVNQKYKIDIKIAQKKRYGYTQL